MRLIQGEHIDYSNFSVLPMAIDADIILALQVLSSDESDEGIIMLSNANPRFPQRKIVVDRTNPSEPVRIDSTTLGIRLLCVLI